MFTGIVTDMGEVLELEQRGDLRARIGTAYDVARVEIGAPHQATDAMAANAHPLLA